MYQRKAIAAGMAMGTGSLLYLALNGGVLGTIAFSLGMMFICVLQLDLFTGKIYPFIKKQIDIQKVVLTLLGNLVGVYIIYCLGTALPSYHNIKEMSQTIMQERLLQPFGFILVRGIFCGVCVQMGWTLWNSEYNHYRVYPLFALLPCMMYVYLGGCHCIADFIIFLYNGDYMRFSEILEVLCGNIIGILLFAGASTDTPRNRP